MKLVTQIGTQRNAYLELPNGNVIRVSLTNDEYQNVSEDNLQSKIPTGQRRGIFKYAVEEPLFDTQSGFIEEDCFAINPSGGYWVREIGKETVGDLHQEYVVDGQITDTSKIMYF